ncbi:hypothetical protein CPSG_02470 [Coccidioides posadasii str. Silveira]|uniref:Uncharacterized protein n=1 Tax=Coccidioides posadasii (strain RMSCC 757 / Silveira) TaxID=443226 RepID=E9CZI3_COCPS|nr:hypothetical protein CPSG_02470 [Coccidioides posadasii str. Silveira]
MAFGFLRITDRNCDADLEAGKHSESRLFAKALVFLSLSLRNQQVCSKSGRNQYIILNALFEGRRTHNYNMETLLHMRSYSERNRAMIVLSERYEGSWIVQEQANPPNSPMRFGEKCLRRAISLMLPRLAACWPTESID